MKSSVYHQFDPHNTRYRIQRKIVKIVLRTIILSHEGINSVLKLKFQFVLESQNFLEVKTSILPPNSMKDMMKRLRLNHQIALFFRWMEQIIQRELRAFKGYMLETT